MNERIRELAGKFTHNAKGSPVVWEWKDKFSEIVAQEGICVLKGDMRKMDKAGRDISVQTLDAELARLEDFLEYKG